MKACVAMHENLMLCVCADVQGETLVCLLTGVCRVTHIQTVAINCNTNYFMWCSLHSDNSCLSAYRHFGFHISNVCNLCGLQGKGGWKAKFYILSTRMIKRSFWIITQRHSCTTSSHATYVHKIEAGNQNVRESGFIHVFRFICAFWK